MLNYENINQPTHGLSSNALVKGTTEGGNQLTHAPIRKNPKNSSEILHNLQIDQTVTMLREWVDGQGDWALVKFQISENNSVEGYILTKYLYRLSQYAGRILPKEEIVLEQMSPMAKVLIPTWYESSIPYYHRENGEWFVTVTLPYTCLQDGQDYENKKQEAKLEAIKQIYKFLDIPYAQNSDESDADFPQPSPQEFQNGLLSCAIKDFYISTRPGSKLKMLAVIPAIYLQPLINAAASEIDHHGDDKVPPITISIPINNLDSLSENTTHCLKKHYKKYLSSDLFVTNFNFENEIKKQQDAISKIKFLLKSNGVNLGESLNTKSGTDPSSVSGGILTLSFSSGFKLSSIEYVNEKGEEDDLPIGFNYVKNSYPFNEPRVSFLFVKQRQLCDPTLTLKQFFSNFVIDPAPKFKDISVLKNAMGLKKVGDFGKLGLGMSLDLDSVLKDIALDFNGNLGLDGNIDFGSFNFSGNDLDFKLKAIELRDLDTLNVGDFLTNPDFTKGLVWKLGFGGLDDLYNLVLKYIEFDKLFNFIGSYYSSASSLDLSSIPAPNFGGLDSAGFDFPNFSGFGDFSGKMKGFQASLGSGLEAGFEGIASNLADGSLDADFGDLSLNLDFGLGKGLGGYDFKTGDGSFNMDNFSAGMPSIPFVGGGGGFGIPTFRVSLPTFSLVIPLNMGIEGAIIAVLAQIILQLIIYLLETIIKMLQSSNSQACDPKLKKPLPSVDVIVDKDYGSENLNDLLRDSIGIYDDDVYAERVAQILDICGVPMEGISNEPDNVSKSTAVKYLDSVSYMVTASELLSLFEGTASQNVLEEILDHTKDDYPTIYVHKNTISKISDLFVCIGENISTDAKEKVEENIENTYKNPEICQDIMDELMKLMKDKCPDPLLYESVYEKEITSRVNKYKDILNILNSSFDPSAMSPSMFSDGETDGLLSLKDNRPKNQDFLIERLGETMALPTKITLETESQQYMTEKLDSNNKFSNLIKTEYEKGSLAKKTNAKGTIYKYNIGSNPPLYKLTNSEERLSNVVVNDIEQSFAIRKKVYPTPEKMQSMLDNDTKYQVAKAENSFPKQHGIFYSLMQAYFAENVFNADNGKKFSPTSNHQGLEFPLPYAVTKGFNGGPEFDDTMFSLVYTTIMERISRSVGDYWSTVSDNKLQQYSNQLNSNVNNIIDFEKSKDQMVKYYDLGEYDDPNSEIIGKKEYAILNGLLEMYFKTYLYDFFCRGIPHYALYKFPNGSADIYDISKNYINTIMILDLAAINQSFSDYKDMFNEVFDYMVTKVDIDTDKYNGPARGRDYYFDKHFSDVYDEFRDSISNLNNEKSLNAQMILNAGATMLPVHEYAGPIFLASDEQLLSNQKLTSVLDVSNKDYSLFHPDRFSFFKDGGFFFQFYYRIEDYENSDLTERSKTTKSIINYEEGIKILTALLTHSDAKAGTQYLGKKLSELFKDVKIGVRLCYGIAHKKGSSDPQTITFANSLFKNYAYYKINSGILVSDEDTGKKLWQTYVGLANAVMSAGKYIICLDGNETKFDMSHTTYQMITQNLALISKGEEVANSKDYFEDLLSDFMTNHSLQTGDFLTPDGTFSIVLPFVSSEQSVDLNQNFAQFSSKAQNGYANEFENLRLNIINSSEYEALRNICFSLGNILHFSAISGIQYYSDNNKELQQAFNQSKTLLKRNIDAMLNSKKFDYIP